MKKILIIEDDEKIALALSVRLKAHGYCAWIAGDGITALNLAMRQRPDLVVLDISLPAGNGFELAERFQTLPETRETPIIFATASKDPDLRKRAVRAGAAGLLVTNVRVSIASTTTPNWSPTGAASRLFISRLVRVTSTQRRHCSMPAPT